MREGERERIATVVCSFLFCLKESVERITLLNLQFCWFYWFKSENTHYQKLWTSLERREKQALRLTNFFSADQPFDHFLLLPLGNDCQHLFNNRLIVHAAH